MKKITLKGRKIISNILKGFSLTTAMFIFQSCYGVPPAFPDALVTGKVTSSSNNQGIKGIKVSTGHYDYTDTNNYGYVATFTDNNGEFSFHTDLESGTWVHKIFFEDIDGSENGLYESKFAQIKGAEKVHISIILNEIKQDSISL